MVRLTYSLYIIDRERERKKKRKKKMWNNHLYDFLIVGLPSLYLLFFFLTKQMNYEVG